MSISIVRHLPEQQWRCFVDEHPQSNIFHTPEMFQVFAQARNHQPLLWAAQDEQGHILALLTPVQIKTLGYLFPSFTSRLVMYGGILYQPSSNGYIALQQLLSTCTHAAAKYTLLIEVRNMADISSIQSTLQNVGFTFQEHDNFLINLNLPVEAIRQNMSKSARKHIRRALKKNQLAITEITEHSQLKTWYALLQKTYHKARVPLANYDLFESAFDILYPKKMIQFLLGRVQDTYVAASVALLYKHVIYGWYRGFNRDYSSYLPNDLMVWQVLKWGANSGYHTFDFGGAGKPNENYGPRKFKAKFGGNLVSYGRNICIHSHWKLKLSEKLYKLYRNLL